MYETIRTILERRTLGMFSKDWYDETSRILEDSLSENGKIGSVYFIFSPNTGLTKIGYSVNVEARVKSISKQVGVAFLIGTFITSDYKELESDLHLKYRDNRITGEWFDFGSYGDSYDIFNNLEIVGCKKTISYNKDSRSTREIISHELFSNHDFNRSKLSRELKVSRQTIHKIINEIKK